MGHFGYGDSSILLVCEPGLDLQLAVGGQPVGDPDNPVLMKVKQCFGKRTMPLSW
jgi:hypothetical protein